MFLALIFCDNFIPGHFFQKSYPDERNSGTSQPTSLNGSNIQDAAVTPVHRCTLCTFFSKAQIDQIKDVSQNVTLHRPNHLIKRWMAYSNIMDTVPDSLVR